MTIHTADYRQWLGELKTRFRQVQPKAAVAVNTAMLQFYGDLGADMVVKQTQFAWGMSSDKPQSLARNMAAGLKPKPGDSV